MDDVLVDVRKYDLADRLKLDFISVNTLLNKLEDALDEIERLKEEIEDTKVYYSENYEPRNFKPYDEYGINEKDFH